MKTNPCRIATCLTVAACIAMPGSLARGAEDDADVVDSPLEEQVRKTIDWVRAADRQERIADAKERIADAQARLAAATKELAGAWKARLHDVPTDRAFLGVLIAGQDEHGIRVGGLSPQGGAERAGLLAEDVIVAIDGESLVGTHQPLRRLQRALGAVEPGASVALAVLRDGEELEFDVTTTPSVSVRWLDDLFDHEWLANDAGGWVRRRPLRDDGLELVDIGEDLGAYFGVDAGVLVLDTPADSPLRPGDIVRRIAGAAVSSAEDAYRLRRRLEAEAEVEVRRKNRNVTVVLAPRPAPDRSAPRWRKRAVIVVDPDEETVYEVDEEIEAEAE